MALDLLLEQFDGLIQTPADVKKLEQSILQWAVMGRLVPQDANDEPACVLLERITAEKARLVKEKKIKKPKKLPPISGDEIPYPVPSSWKWVRLPEIYYSHGQTKPNKLFTYIDVSAINKEDGVIGDELEILKPENAPSRARKLVANGSILYSTVRPYLLNIAIVDREIAPKPIVSTAFAVMQPFTGVSNRFLYFYLRSKPFIEFVESQMTGMAYPAISDSKLNLGLVPIPPLEEQKRIVARVDELFEQTGALAAQLEAAQKTRTGLQRAIVSQVVSTISISRPLEAPLAPPKPSSQDIRALLIAQFDRLHSQQADVEALKQTILQLAVMGRLVPQDPNDEPACVLLERITAQKARLVKEKKIKKPKKLPPISGDEIPFDLPSGWVWAKLGHLSKVVEYGTSQKASEFPSKGIPILRMNNIKNGQIVYNKLKYVSPKIKDLPRLYLRNNDLLFNRTNSYELVGKTGVFKGEDESFTAASYLIRVTLFKSKILPDYVNIYFNTPICRTSQIEPQITQQTGQANFNGTKLQNVLVPVPPTCEQKRIVARVDELFALCDQLAAGLESAEVMRGRFLDAVLGQAI